MRFDRSDVLGALGPYRLVRQEADSMLGPGLRARRWVALHERLLTNHTVYALEGCSSRVRMRRVMGAVERLAGLQTSHAQSPREVCCCSARGMCLVTDYTGDNLGLRTMRALLQERARPVENAECRRAAEHVLGAIAAAHAAGIPDGALTLNRLLVDRAGRISVELLGLWSAVRGYGDSAQARRRDVSEAVRMIRAMVIGRAEVDDLGGGSLRPAVIAEAWAGWISQGAGEGFETADAALAALPPTSGGVPTVGVVRGLFDRIRSAVSGS